MPLGQAVGIKLFAQGVLVVGLSDITTQEGPVSPARACGLQAGDVITHINGEKVSKASDLSDKVQNHKIGEEVTLTIVKSDGSQTDVKVKLGDSSVN